MVFHFSKKLYKCCAKKIQEMENATHEPKPEQILEVETKNAQIIIKLTPGGKLNKTTCIHCRPYVWVNHKLVSSDFDPEILRNIRR